MPIFRFLPTALVASAVIAVSGALVLQPALARSVVQTLAGITNCSSSLPCSGWNNTGSGPAVQGTAAGTDGIKGFSTGTGKSGVYGETDASAGGYGVHGANSSVNGAAIYGLGRVGVGVSSYAYGSKPSLLSNAAGGDAADLLSSSGVGAIIADGANASNGVNHILGEGGKPGAIIGGAELGAIITAGKDGTPLVVQGTSESGGGEVTIDSTGNINTTGDVIYGGALIGPSIARNGMRVTSYVTKTTQSNVEDSGSAQLVGGTAVVRLDPAYSQSIDMQTPYHVFLTPNADTRGLYIAQKTATAFVVRESQGGRGTFTFDYRILGVAAGHTTDRMAFMPPAPARMHGRRP